MSKEYVRRRFSKETTEIRAEFRKVRSTLRDACMWQTARGEGNHVAAITEIDETEWHIEVWTEHPTYKPTTEQLLNTVIDIVTDSTSGNLVAEAISETEVIVRPDEFWN